MYPESDEKLAADLIKLEKSLELSAVGIGITLTGAQILLCLRFAEQILITNKTMNLTRITQPDAVAVRHFADSLTVFHALPGLSVGANVVDVGTGAGFPGVVLAIVRPDLRVTLLDSVGKRLTFLQTVAADLGLTNVRTLHTRAEDAGRDPVYRDGFDVVVARAVANLPTLLEWCAPLIAVGGRFVAMKGNSVGEVGGELSQGEAARQMLKLDKPAILNIELPSVGEEAEPAARMLLTYRKHAPTPPRFPRTSAEIKAKPLLAAVDAPVPRNVKR